MGCSCNTKKLIQSILKLKILKTLSSALSSHVLRQVTQRKRCFRSEKQANKQEGRENKNSNNCEKVKQYLRKVISWLCVSPVEAKVETQHF